MFSLTSSPSISLSQYSFRKDLKHRKEIPKDKKNYILIGTFGERKPVLSFLGELRIQLAELLKCIDKNKFEFCWIINFPLFEWSDEENKIVSVHHPFTAPKKQDIDKIEKNLFNVKSRSYDFVLNGVELGGGSIRIHETDIQNRIFSALGLTEDETRKKFGFLIDALQFGAPPHGGIAFGLDRIVMMLQGEDSIRDVIPFPKTSKGTCPTYVKERSWIRD